MLVMLSNIEKRVKTEEKKKKTSRKIPKQNLQMHLSITKYPLCTHVFGDAADTASRFKHDLRARRGRLKAQEAIPVDQDLEVAFIHSG